jgi:hypothetical protein
MNGLVFRQVAGVGVDVAVVVRAGNEKASV